MQGIVCCRVEEYCTEQLIFGPEVHCSSLSLFDRGSRLCTHSNHLFYIECSEISYNRLTFIDIFTLSVIAKSEPNMNAVTFV
jgi:hypothetical protein